MITTEVTCNCGARVFKATKTRSAWTAAHRSSCRRIQHGHLVRELRDLEEIQRDLAHRIHITREHIVNLEFESARDARDKRKKAR